MFCNPEPFKAFGKIYNPIASFDNLFIDHPKEMKWHIEKDKHGNYYIWESRGLSPDENPPYETYKGVNGQNYTYVRANVIRPEVIPYLMSVLYQF